MAGLEHYVVGSHREAVTPYLFGRLLSVEEVMIALGSSPNGDSAVYHADAEDAGLIKALRTGWVKSGASDGSERRLLPPAFWKMSNGALNAFVQGIIETPDNIDIPGLLDVQGWRVVFDETSFESWRNGAASNHPREAITSIPIRKIKKPNVPKNELEKFLKKDGTKLDSLPSRDAHWKMAKEHFSNNNVPRTMVNEARKSIWGDIPPGPRKRPKA